MHHFQLIFLTPNLNFFSRQNKQILRMPEFKQDRAFAKPGQQSNLGMEVDRYQYLLIFIILISQTQMYSRTRQNNKKAEDFYKQPLQCIEQTTVKIGLIVAEQKNIVKKKDKAVAKRKMKQEPQKELTQKTPTQASELDQNTQLKSQQSANNSQLQAKDNQPSNQFQEDILKDAYELQKIIRKPNYVKIQDNSIIKGYSGHSSVIFKRPILEGSYYFQVKILQPQQNHHNLTYPPSVRVGLCPNDYPHTIPLGGKSSVCYRSIDGHLIENKKALNFGPLFQEGDLIGVELKIGPPHKHPVKDQKNEESKLTFYKNKLKVGQYENLNQIFYTVGISLFNYATIELRIHQTDIEHLPEGCQPYIQHLNKEIPYQDLKMSRIFSE